jgi:D-glycero-alpha-D-manno-heptose-7-phosphate kinase
VAQPEGECRLIVARAPLRISLAGGGTDLPSYYQRFGGFILSAAIDKYVFIHVNRLNIEDFIRVKYMRTELVDLAEEIEHPLLREGLLHTGMRGGLEISSMADLPSGTGLGGSGSFIVALLVALHALDGEHLTTKALAEEACYVEMVRARQPVGKQDQYIAAYGGLITMDIATDGSVQVTRPDMKPEYMDELRNNTLLLYTGMRRDSFDILADQERQTAAGNQAVIDNLHRSLELGHQTCLTLLEGDFDRYGELLDQHWQAKQQRSGAIAGPEVRRWYALARESGAIGGKLLGAGGGGFLMCYCPSGRAKHNVRRVLREAGLRDMPFQFEPAGARVIAHI